MGSACHALGDTPLLLVLLTRFNAYYDNNNRVPALLIYASISPSCWGDRFALEELVRQQTKRRRKKNLKFGIMDYWLLCIAVTFYGNLFVTAWDGIAYPAVHNQPLICVPERQIYRSGKVFDRFTVLGGVFEEESWADDVRGNVKRSLLLPAQWVIWNILFTGTFY